MGLFSKVKCITFVLVIGLLRDVLPAVLKVSTVFQTDLIDIETVNIMVDATAMKINQLKYKNSPLMSKVSKDMTTTKSMYRGIKLTDREQPIYLQELVENIEDIFDKASMKNLLLQYSVFNPSLIHKNLDGLEDHGEEQLKDMV